MPDDLDLDYADRMEDWCDSHGYTIGINEFGRVGWWEGPRPEVTGLEEVRC